MRANLANRDEREVCVAAYSRRSRTSRVRTITGNSSAHRRSKYRVTLTFITAFESFRDYMTGTRRLSVSLSYCRSQISGIHILQLYLICREHGCGASSLLATERNYDCATKSKSNRLDRNELCDSFNTSQSFLKYI